VQQQKWTLPLTWRQVLGEDARDSGLAQDVVHRLQSITDGAGRGLVQCGKELSVLQVNPDLSSQV
jgi:hypothetical protein